MNDVGIMGAKSHHRNGRIRWRYGAGAWIALLAVFLNALATVVFAPIPAQAGEDVAWVHICTPDVSTAEQNQSKRRSKTLPL